MEENQYIQVLNDIESNKDFTKEEYEEYSKSKDFSVRELIAAYEKTPKDILLKLAKDNVVRVRLAVIKNIKFDDDIFNCYISEQKSEITFGDLYDLTEEDLEEFAKKDFTQFHPTILTKVIEIIKYRGIKYLIKLLFENKSIENNRLKMFIESKDYEIKNLFFEFQRIDEELLKILEKDYDKKISKKASKYLKIINIDFEKMKEELNSNPSEETLINLSYVDDEDVKIKLVSHSLVTEKVLEILSKDESCQIRVVVAKSPLINDNIVKNILDYQEYQAYNERVDIEEIAQSDYLYRITPEVQILFYDRLKRIIKSRSYSIIENAIAALHYLVLNQNISNDLMIQMTSDFYLQKQLLSNKSINKEVLKILILKAPYEISKNAKEKLEKIEKESFIHYLNIKFADSEELAMQYLKEHELYTIDLKSIYAAAEEDIEKVNKFLMNYTDQERYELAEKFFAIDEKNFEEKYQFCKENDLIGCIPGVFKFSEDFIKTLDKKVNVLEALNETQLIEFLLGFDKNKPEDIKIVKENKELIEVLFKKYFCFNDEIKKILENEIKVEVLSN